MTFVSLGQALCSVTVAIMRKFVLLLPLIYIVPALVENKTMGVYLAEPIADVLAVTFTAILFVFVFKRAMKRLEKEAE
jgi:Na+-driven multidrug efflux pump